MTNLSFKAHYLIYAYLQGRAYRAANRCANEGRHHLDRAARHEAKANAVIRTYLSERST